jgi:Arc/MetJ family transcription regulator
MTVMHMRTTLDLPENLLAEAQQLTGSATKKETVVTALEEVIRARRRQELIDMLGTVKLNLTPEDIREMREGRKPPPKDAPLIYIHPSEGRHRCPPKFIPDWDDES